MKTLYESLLDTETAIEKATNIVEKRYFLSVLSDLIGTDMNDYNKKWKTFINVLNSQCKPIKEPYLDKNEVIIAYKEDFKISDNLIGNKSNNGVGTLLILYGENLPDYDKNYIHVNKFYKHDLYTGNSIFTMKLSVGVYSQNITEYNRFIKTLKKMNLYKISGEIADKLIEISRYNDWNKKSY